MIEYTLKFKCLKINYFSKGFFTDIQIEFFVEPKSITNVFLLMLFKTSDNFCSIASTGIEIKIKSESLI